MTRTEAILADPEWLAHRHVEDRDAVRFRHVPRARHAAVPFLVDDYLGAAETTVDIPLVECLSAVPRRPLHFVFHSAFCGSTMLARALDRPGIAMALSEPVILNDVVGFRRRGAPADAVARLADGALRLLARPFGAGEALLVKPSNVINPLAELLLALAPGSQAVFLFAPLETFLVSVARKGLPCRLWARELADGYLTDAFLQPLGFAHGDLFRQSDLQVAATGWLAQHRFFLALREKVGPSRLAFLDSETLTGDPDRAVGAVARHFGIAMPDGPVAGGEVFSRHSKSGQPYSAEDRASDYAAVRAAHGEEIAMVVTWAGRVAKPLGIELDPPGRLAQPGS